MRKIKFRAWADEKMYKNVGVVGDIVVLEYESSEEWFDVHLEPTYYGLQDDSIKLMQYTGLKNGWNHEIYEGDIIEHITQDYVAGFPREEKHVYEVTYEFGAFWVGDTLLIDAIENDSETKVIGNIYENPELLEVD